MKSLKTLIKLKQRELDEKRRILVQLEEELDRLLKDEKRLKDELARESALASGNPELGRYFGEFAKGNRRHQEQNREKQAAMRSLIESQQNVIQEAFAELKQLEIAKQKQDEDEAADANRKEGQMLDEIGIRGFNTSS